MEEVTHHSDEAPWPPLTEVLNSTKTLPSEIVRKGRGAAGLYASVHSPSGLPELLVNGLRAGLPGLLVSNTPASRAASMTASRKPEEDTALPGNAASKAATT